MAHKTSLRGPTEWAKHLRRFGKKEHAKRERGDGKKIVKECVEDANPDPTRPAQGYRSGLDGEMMWD